MVVGESTTSTVSSHRSSSFTGATPFPRPPRDRKVKPHHHHHHPRPHSHLQTGLPSSSSKEERDRQKLVEKKKRRLEKALATAAAIRLELEKKKQRKKEEEEQRLDQEGAALAEAVALHVLVDEDSEASVDNSSGHPSEAGPTPVQSEELGSHSCSSRVLLTQTLNILEKETPNQGAIDSEPALLLPLNGSPTQIPTDDAFSGQICSSNAGRAWELFQNQGVIASSSDSPDGVIAKKGGGWEAGSWPWSVMGSMEQAKVSTDKATAAQVAAGVAAAQAVAALRIAEEARAEAEAAKKAAEAALIQGCCHSRQETFHQGMMMMHPNDIERERDELKARLAETEEKLKEKTQRVSQLEGNLEEVTQHLLEMKALVGGCKKESIIASGSQSEGGSDSTPADFDMKSGDEVTKC